MIDYIDPKALTRKQGFRSRKPDAMTMAERQRKYRRKQGGRLINATLAPDVAACLIYLRREWGMESDREAVEAAVRFLSVCTRQGLQRIPQSVDD
jgi:hypothetical protein